MQKRIDIKFRIWYQKRGAKGKGHSGTPAGGGRHSHGRPRRGRFCSYPERISGGHPRTASGGASCHGGPSGRLPPPSPVPPRMAAQHHSASRPCRAGWSLSQAFRPDSGVCPGALLRGSSGQTHFRAPAAPPPAQPRRPSRAI